MSSSKITRYFWLCAVLFLLVWLFSFFQIFCPKNVGVPFWVPCLLFFLRWYYKNSILQRFFYGICTLAVLPFVVYIIVLLSPIYRQKQLISIYHWVSVCVMLFAIIYTIYFMKKGYKTVNQNENL